MHAVITENDSSQWDDKTGVHYHFPARYLKFLIPGTQIIYYKGRLKETQYAQARLSKDPHYFGKGIIGEVKKEENNKNYYATIIDYSPFETAIPFKINGLLFENIPSNRSTNYWRDGVRPINKETYNKIIQLVDVVTEILNDRQEDELTTIIQYEEGGKKMIYTTRYERDKKLRAEAVNIHGYTCTCCDFNFKETYGKWGEGYIHVHHKKPISSVKEKGFVDPKIDLDVVCPNCHSMIHRDKNKLLSIEELREMIRKNRENK